MQCPKIIEKGKHKTRISGNQTHNIWSDGALDCRAKWPRMNSPSNTVKADPTILFLQCTCKMKNTQS